MNSIYYRITTSRSLCWLSAGIAVIITFLWFYVTKRYSVNVLFSDAWDFHRVFIWDYSLIQQYNYQFGPQRLGMGLIFTGWINNLSGWDSNWISMTVSILIFFSCLIYLIIRRKLFGKLNPFDVSVFIIILSLLQYEVFVITPFLSYAAVPLFLLSLFCLSLFIKPMMYRNMVLLIVNFNLVYSSFGFFAGLITIVLFVFELINSYQEKERKNLLVGEVSLILASATMILFFVGYNSDYATENALILWKEPWKYLFYISLSYAGFFGFKGTGAFQIAFGMLVFGSICFVLWKSISEILRNHKGQGRELVINKILFVLTAFSLLFVVNLSFGRIRLGFEFAGSSRYMPYLAPSIIGLYFYLNNLKPLKKSVFIPFFFASIMLVQFSSMRSVNEIKAWHDMKSNWKSGYLKYEDADKADSISNFKVYPDNKGIRDILEFLKEHHYNLYKDPLDKDFFSDRNKKPQ